MCLPFSCVQLFATSETVACQAPLFKTHNGINFIDWASSTTCREGASPSLIETINNLMGPGGQGWGVKQGSVHILHPQSPPPSPSDGPLGERQRGQTAGVVWPWPSPAASPGPAHLTPTPPPTCGCVCLHSWKPTVMLGLGSHPQTGG